MQGQNFASAGRGSVVDSRRLRTNITYLDSATSVSLSGDVGDTERVGEGSTIISPFVLACVGVAYAVVAALRVPTTAALAPRLRYVPA